MHQYLNLLEKVRAQGRKKEDRTGTGTLSLFGEQMRFDLNEGFPLVTTKRVFIKGVIHELLWFLMGETNIRYLLDNGVHIWDAWADERGELGPVYGSQWRSWPDQNDGYIDQIDELVFGLKNDPFSRRHIVSAWNVADLPRMALAPCHCLFQFHVEEMTLAERLQICPPDYFSGMHLPTEEWTSNGQVGRLMDDIGIPRRKLACQLYQRSADLFLGVPFNIASYALLTMMLAQVCGYHPGELIWTGGDCHIYSNHLKQVDLQLSRDPRKLPRMLLNPEVKDIFDFKFEDFRLVDYDSWTAIRGEVAV